MTDAMYVVGSCSGFHARSNFADWGAAAEEPQELTPVERNDADQGH